MASNLQNRMRAHRAIAEPGRYKMEIASLNCRGNLSGLHQVTSDDPSVSVGSSEEHPY